MVTSKTLRKVSDCIEAMSLVQSVTLDGKGVRLVPLSHEHHDQLVEALQDGQLWKLWYTSIPAPEGLRAEIDRRLALQSQGSMLPFAVIAKSSGQAVGMTTYMNIDTPNRRVEIGSTWYRRSVQRTGLNTECKLLLLRHAFETLNTIAVEFRTHAFNRQSRAAIEETRGEVGRSAATASAGEKWHACATPVSTASLIGNGRW